MSEDELRLHGERLREEISYGFVVPFLGAGVNLLGRPAGGVLVTGDRSSRAGGSSPAISPIARTFPGSATGSEATSSGSPSTCTSRRAGDPSTTSCTACSTPTTRRDAVHASGPAGPLCCESGHGPITLVVTTNYDDALERAYASSAGL